MAGWNGSRIRTVPVRRPGVIFDWCIIGPLVSSTKSPNTGGIKVGYPLVCFGAQGSDPAGHALPMTCTGGSITVNKACRGDCNGDHRVTIDEFLTGVNNVLNGCLRRAARQGENGCPSLPKFASLNFHGSPLT